LYDSTRVVALDDDSGRNAEVEYRWNDPSEYGDMFVIHPTTGMITTKAAFRAGDEQSLKVGGVSAFTLVDQLLVS